MKPTFRIGLIAFGVIIIIGQAILIDYSDLSWSENSGSYLGIISMILMIIMLLLTIRDSKRKS